MQKTKKVLAAAALVGLLAGCSSLSGGGSEEADPNAEFPGNEPITVIAPYTAGGSSDLLIRAFIPFLAEELGTDVIVENLVGAGGQIGLTSLAYAGKDGHTIGLTNLPSSLAYINPDKQASYDMDSFVALGAINRFRGIVASSSNSPWTNLEEFIAAAEADPGALTVGVDGLTGDDHIAVLDFMEATETDLKIVPFDSGSEKLTALIGGQVDISLGSVPTFKAQLDTGEVRMLAALDPEPIPGFEDIETAEAQGYPLYWKSYNVLSAPAGISAEVQATLEEAIANAAKAASKDAAFMKQMDAGGYVFEFQDAEWARSTWAELDELWQELVPRARQQ